jgi:hypothetical protein
LAEHGVAEVGLLMGFGVGVVGWKSGCMSKSTWMIVPVNLAMGP